ncbi:hypothetical protein HanIR_Chr12g0581551 [Helianthus annuus]|nr:hypothetical protein HanIR_Chr12g0581551 [Helianthus annuus]
MVFLFLRRSRRNIGDIAGTRILEVVTSELTTSFCRYTFPSLLAYSFPFYTYPRKTAMIINKT